MPRVFYPTVHSRRRREDHSETGDRQPEKHLTGREEIGDPRGAEEFELGKPGGVGVRPGHPRTLELDRVVPDLLPGLTKEVPGTPAVRRSLGTVDQSLRRGCRQLLVLGGHPAGEDRVDVFVVTTSSLEESRVGEVIVGDDREQCLREVEVDVGVDAEENMLQRMQIGWRVERQPPGSRYARVAGEIRVEGIEVEVGEVDGPLLDPGASSNTPCSMATPTADVVRT